jgi:hypothetical protein
MRKRFQGRSRLIGAEARALGLYSAITRRDFIGSTLIGSGAMLLGAAAPAFAQGLTPEWNGYTGVGDYSRSNGNIASVVNAAHGIRDGIYESGIIRACCRSLGRDRDAAIIRIRCSQRHGRLNEVCSG